MGVGADRLAGTGAAPAASPAFVLGSLVAARGGRADHTAAGLNLARQADAHEEREHAQPLHQGRQPPVDRSLQVALLRIDLRRP